jgi:hypothetical protein
MEQVIQTWEADFLPVQHEVESLGCIVNGKVVQGGQDRRNVSPTNGHRRPSSHRQATSPGRGLPPPAPAMDTKPQLGAASPSGINHQGGYSTSPRIPTPAVNIPIPEPSPSSSALNVPDTPYSLAGGHSPAGPRSDHFIRDRQPSAMATSPGSTVTGLGSLAGKKKPPPPPPPRVNASGSQAIFVTALYDFGGQGAGDLAFREGDRIRVVKKTDSTDDWWEGELRGVKGSFPANYCQ